MPISAQMPPTMTQYFERLTAVCFFAHSRIFTENFPNALVKFNEMRYNRARSNKRRHYHGILS